MRLLRLAAVAAVMAVASPAIADDATCVQSYESTQTLRKAGKLRDARAEAAKCADSSCPSVLSKDCQKWLAELDATLPTVVFEVKGSAGEALTNVKVTLNGQPLVDKIDATPVVVDSGAVTFHFESPDGKGKPVDRAVTLKDGEKAHKVSVTLGGSVVVAAESERPIPLGAVVFGAAGVALAGVGAVFAITGSSSENDLGSCKPHCSADAVNSVSTKYAVADILFTAGAVSIVAAAYLFITRPSALAARTASTFRRKSGFVLEF